MESSECRFLREQWLALSQVGITIASLQAFYARYKYLIMSRHLASYHEIGTLLASANRNELPVVAQRLFELMGAALAIPATYGGNVNALLHISGYLKEQLSSEAKRDLLAVIERHRRGEVELDVPVAIMRAYFCRFPNAYIEQQVFLQALV